MKKIPKPNITISIDNIFVENIPKVLVLDIPNAKSLDCISCKPKIDAMAHKMNTNFPLK